MVQTKVPVMMRVRTNQPRGSSGLTPTSSKVGCHSAKNLRQTGLDACGWQTDKRTALVGATELTTGDCPLHCAATAVVVTTGLRCSNGQARFGPCSVQWEAEATKHTMAVSYWSACYLSCRIIAPLSFNESAMRFQPQNLAGY